jgi:sarcosine oxidase subunit alpha
MSTRLATGGRRIDRQRRLDFTWNGRPLQGVAGDTLASALLANGERMIGRSFKYHRPRGIVASGPEEPNALVHIGEAAHFEPNQRATVTPLYDGLTAASQNHWPSLKFDIGAVNGWAARLLPAGFYYKTFLWPRAFWKHLYEPAIRQSAGLGRAPRKPDADRYEYVYLYTDLLIVGGGIAGLAAALVAGRAGLRVLLIEQDSLWGGRAPVDGGALGGTIADQPAADWVAGTVAELAALPNVTLRTRTVGTGINDHGYVTAWEHLADHAPGDPRPRQRLWRIRARHVITATGAIERPLAFAGNDLPGVMLAGAARDYVADYAVSPGDRTVVVTNNDDGYRTALALKKAGLDVPAVIDARADADGALPAAVRAHDIRVETGRGIARVLGRSHVQAVEICAQAGEGTALETLPCEAVAMSGGWSPAVHLWSHCGGKLIWDTAQAQFRPDPDRPPLGAHGTGFVTAAGSANGAMQMGACLADGLAAGTHATKALGGSASGPAPIAVEAPEEAPMQPVWIMPQGANVHLRQKMWLDFQNDVKVSDVQLAAREGYVSVEHAKRYTTLGMATDQGKLSNINGLAVLADARGAAIPDVGTTTFRPPWTPVTLGAMAGEARGPLFKPLRKTPMDAWHDENGAYWEPVGDWRRPYCYRHSGESVKNAVSREVLNTRQNLGLLDASTLGKILVKGPDAGRFLDMLYTNMMSSLKPGRCRYGLMCTENGFLMDDGVVARIDEDTFLCHTTTGGSDRIHAWMEEWLQTEWWTWQVYTANLTEQFAQIAVVGPNARAVLDRLGGMDVSADALPFMAWKDGTLGGFAARVFRISFSGELSYEIAVPASHGQAIWNRLLDAGDAFGAAPYGTEALHIMRAEKGFIMIGDETDGTVTPQDLGLDWAVSQKKADFLGKRAQARADLTRPDRWRLVGLETLDPRDVLPDGAYATDGTRIPGGAKRMVGRVTSTYFSPTLGRSIAMGLVANGPERMGAVLSFPTTRGRVIRARIVDPVFYDKDGTKQDA